MVKTLVLEGQAAIVTGASRGIGRAVAVALAEAGASVVAVGRDAEALTEVVAASGEGTILAHAADLRNPEAAGAVVATAQDSFGGVDILVNCAGATVRGDFLSLSDDDFLDGFALKFHAAVRLCRLAWPALAKRHGKIVNIGGIGAHTPSWEFTVGGPVNQALANFTKSIAEGGLRDGIRVNLVHPGHVETDRLTRRIDTLMSNENLSRQDAVTRMLAEHGIARFGKPEELAAVVRFLCSDEASYIHGVALDVDGGATQGL